MAIFYLIQGAIWILLLYNLSLYFMARRSFNLSYSAYLLFVSLNFINVKFSIFSILFPDVHPAHLKTKFETYYVESFMYISYFLFIRHYIESKSKYPSIDTLLKVMILNSTVEIFITNFLLQTGSYNLLNYLIHGLKVANMLCAIGLIPLFYKNYNQLISYLFFGGTSLLIGTVLYFATFNMPNWNHNIWEPYYFIYLGIFIEIIIFSLGIGYRFKLIQDEKIKAQNELIENYKTREQYEQQLNIKMKQELEKRGEEMSEKNKQMYEIKLAQELSDAKMQLLTARMNPHFIFNSLNSLKDLIIKRKDAIPFIDKFSVLLRGILMQSEAPFIYLTDEIKTLTHYLDLENLRFGNTIQFEIIIDEGLDISDKLIPPMLLQPLVENALLHGLRPKRTESKELFITFKNDLDKLQIIVDDNGVGRQKKNPHKNSYRSVGMELIKRRLDILNVQNNVNSNLKIIDKKGHDGKAQGTKVILSLITKGV